MKNLNDRVPIIHLKPWVFIMHILLMLVISSCTSDGGSSQFTPQNTLNGRILVYGTHIVGGDLVVYVNGTDTLGTTLTVTDLQAATVSLNGIDVDAADLTVEGVNNGEDILSVSLLTDYSNSMEDAELDNISNIYTLILDNMPRVFEAQIINFSDTYDEKLIWTEATAGTLATIKSAVALDNTIVRNETALYDAIGFALEGPAGGIAGGSATQGDGLIERCRPAHMLIVFTDGIENSSTAYTDKAVLTSLIETSQTVPIMLGTSTADEAELLSLAGESGGFVQVFDTDGILAEVTNWTQSLSELTKFTLSAASGFDGKIVRITLGSQSVVAVRPTDALCETTVP